MAEFINTACYCVQADAGFTAWHQTLLLRSMKVKVQPMIFLMFLFFNIRTNFLKKLSVIVGVKGFKKKKMQHEKLQNSLINFEIFRF